MEKIVKIDTFNQIAKKYDSQREKIIPCYNDFYKMIANNACSELINPKILDLGSGTGLLSKHLLTRYKDGYFTLIDLSDEMISIAKKRFENNSKFKFIIADYTDYLFNEQYDTII